MHRTGRSGLPTMPTIVDKRAGDAPRRRILKRRDPPRLLLKREPTPDPIEEWSSSEESTPPEREPPVPTRRIQTFDSCAARGVQPTTLQRSIVQLNITKKRKIISPPDVEDSSDEESLSKPSQKKVKLQLREGESEGNEGGKAEPIVEA